MPYLFPPIPINLTDDATFPPQGMNNDQSVQSGPFLFGGILYCICQVGKFPNAKSDAYRSLDNGLTWTVVAQGTNANTNGQFGAAFNGTNIIRIVFCAGNGFNTLGASSYQDFDMSTETWGGAVAGGPSTRQVYGASFFASGACIVFFSENNLGPNQPVSRASIINSGGGWGAGPVDVEANAIAAFPPNGITPVAGNVSYIMDPTGTVCHLTFAYECYFPNFPTVETYFCYQQMASTLAITNFKSFGPRGDYPNDAQSLANPPNPIIYGDNVLLAYSSNTIVGAQSVEVGTPLSGPNFTAFTQIDAAYSLPGNEGNNNGKFAIVGGVLYLIGEWNTPDGSTQANRLRLLKQTSTVNPGAGWLGVGSGAIFDGATDGGPGWVQGFLISPQVVSDKNGNPSVSVNSQNTNGDGLIVTYWLEFLAPPPPPAAGGGGPGIVGAAGRGGPTMGAPFPMAPTFAGRSAFPVEAGKLAREALGQLQEAKRGWPFPWVSPPCGAIRVTEQKTILVPSNNVLTEGILYTVDLGFQFALVAVVFEHILSGVPAADSPGAFLWSMTLNKPVGVTTFQGSPVQGFISVDTGLGTLQDPWPLECPEIFNPNDAIRIEVTNITLTRGTPKNHSYFKAFFLGWRWPIG